MDTFKKIQLQEKLSYANELHEFRKFIMIHNDWKEVSLCACFKRFDWLLDVVITDKNKLKLNKTLLLTIIDELIKANDKELDELLEVKDGNTSSDKTKGRV